MFTDGSKLDGGDVGCAAVIYLPNGKTICLKRKLGRTTSVFIAELTAIETGLKWLVTSKWHQDVTIATDSLSSLKALQDRGNPDPSVVSIHTALRLVRQNHGTNVKFIWVKAHCGIDGNEAADKAAKEAASQRTATSVNEFPISFAKYIIRKRTQAKWQEEYASAAIHSNIFRWFTTVGEIAEFRKHVGPSFESSQIFTGHGFHKSYLHRFKIIDNPYCPCDDSSLQDIDHLMRDCPIFSRLRHEHEMTCNNLRIDPYKPQQIITKSQPIVTFIALINSIVHQLKGINKT
ncbi:uncharacterized protein LOC135074135 [Ostrinia nubilalis]|uniref:uncharacterized protein LOC135074135 n=1 Tax=Ostrinia nubilalis TaxID=29057 RepID=UPI0030822920